MNASTVTTAPVLMIVFRRPSTTQRVFDAVRSARPSQLFIACNAPRDDHRAEQEAVAEVRRIVAAVDWPCEVSHLFRERQLPAKVSIATAIDWFFDQVPAGIILEDDCLPDASFFPYCSELLERYRGDRRVGMISGDNFQFGTRRGAGSYYFSRYAHIWGWASWADRWREGMDPDLRRWPELKQRILALFPGGLERMYWRYIFDAVYRGKIDTWDYQWFLAQLSQHRLCALPQCNLVSNIGFDAVATNTRSKTPASAVPSSPLPLPLSHPTELMPDIAADAYTFARAIRPSIKQMLGRLLRHRTSG